MQQCSLSEMTQLKQSYTMQTTLQFQTITHYLIMMVIFIRRVMQYTISIFLFRCGVYRCISLCFFFKIISMLFSTICRSIHTVSYYLHLILYCKLHEQLCHVIFCFFSLFVFVTPTKDEVANQLRTAVPCVSLQKIPWKSNSYFKKSNFARIILFSHAAKSQYIFYELLLHIAQRKMVILINNLLSTTIRPSVK